MHSDDQEDIPTSGEIAERPKRAVEPGLMELARETKDGILRENLRNGWKARAKKKIARDKYAAKKRVVGLDVRPYNLRPTKAQRRAQKANSKANRSPEQKQKETDAIADHNWRERRLAKGWTDDEIAAALVVRVEERAAKREAARKATEDRESLEQNPNFGKFG